MKLTGALLDAGHFLKENPKADEIFRLLMQKEKHGAYFWWFVKETGWLPEQVKEVLKRLVIAKLIEEKASSTDDPSDAYYELSKLADYLRQVYH